jgi:hypothetical protein
VFGVLVDAVGMDAVAVGEPVGYERRHVGADGPQPQRQDGGGGQAVRIVVAVQEDALPSRDGRCHTFGCGVEGWDRGRCQFGLEARCRRLPEAARPHGGGEQGVDAQLLGQVTNRVDGRRQPQSPLDRRFGGHR